MGVPNFLPHKFMGVPNFLPKFPSKENMEFICVNLCHLWI